MLACPGFFPTYASFWSQRKCLPVIMVLASTLRFSLTPTGCPTIPFNSVLTLPRVSSRPHRFKDSVPQDRPHCRCQLQVLATHTSAAAATDQGTRDPHVRFNTWLEGLTQLRKALYIHLLVYYEGCNSGTVQWKRRIQLRNSLKVFGATVERPYPSRHTSLPASHYVHGSGSFQNLLLRDFYRDPVT